MKKVIIGMTSVAVLGLMASCGNPASASTGPGGGTPAPTPVVPAADLGTAWVATMAAAGQHSQWNAGVADGSGGVLAAGDLVGYPNPMTWNLGNSVTVTTTVGQRNAVLARYDDQGRAQWVRAVLSPSASAQCKFVAVARDGSGNLWAAGSAQGGSGSFDWGGTPARSVPYAGFNPLLVEYDASGTPLRALTIGAATSSSDFLAVACDAAGNVYAAGSFSGTAGGGLGGPSTLTAGQTAAQKLSGTSTVLNRVVSGQNPLLIKYDPSGNFLWAKTLNAGPAAGSAQFTGLVVSGSALYAVGWATGTTAYEFGTAGATVSAAGSSTLENPLVVKFDLDGTPAWARTRTSGTDKFVLSGVAADPSGNLTAVGTVTGTGASGFPSGASLAGGPATSNPAVVAFNAAGSVRWARTLVSGIGQFQLKAVAADADGRVYAAGSRSATVVSGALPEASGFGDGVTLRVGTKANPPGLPFLVVYDAAGKALGASGVISSTAVSHCQYLGVVCPAAGQAVALGQVYGVDGFDFGNGIIKSPLSSGTNAVAAKYTLP